MLENKSNRLEGMTRQGLQSECRDMPEVDLLTTGCRCSSCRGRLSTFAMVPDCNRFLSSILTLSLSKAQHYQENGPRLYLRQWQSRCPTERGCGCWCAQIASSCPRPPSHTSSLLQPACLLRQQSAHDPCLSAPAHFRAQSRSDASRAPPPKPCPLQAMHRHNGGPTRSAKMSHS